MSRPLILGTRGSRLALWQAHHVADRLRALGTEVELRIIRTRGDDLLQISLQKNLDKGFFTGALERALADGGIDLAVHSLKDLPTRLPDGLHLAALPQRAAPGDVLIVRPEAVDPDPAATLPLQPGSVVGTSAARRLAQLRAAGRDLRSPELFRGNVPTRLGRCREGVVDAVILARAGLERLGLSLAGLVGFDLLPGGWVPAAGQGALGLECRTDDGHTRGLLSRLADPDTELLVGLERTLLARVEGGCHAAFGAYAERVEGGIRLSAGLEEEGRPWRQLAHTLPEADADRLPDLCLRSLRGPAPEPPSAARWAPLEPWAVRADDGS